MFVVFALRLTVRIKIAVIKVFIVFVPFYLFFVFLRVVYNKKHYFNLKSY